MRNKVKSASGGKFDNFVIGLSPMDGITDEAFRLTQCEIAKPDLIFTEFVSAEGLAHSAAKLFVHLLFKSIERPITAQLFGKDPASFILPLWFSAVSVLTVSISTLAVPPKQ